MGTRHRITEELVRRGSSRGRTTFVRDNQLIGFALRITAAGAKSFIVEARVNGRMCRFTIGPVDRFTVVEARDKGRALLAGMTSGLDPRIARRAARQRSDTLQAMLDGYIEARAIKASTVGKYRALMRRNLPDWLDRPIADITPQMVLVRYEDLCRTSAASANVVMRALGAICRRAIKVLPDRHDGTPAMKSIPTESLAGNWRTLARKTSLIEPDELPAWWAAVEGVQGEGSRRAMRALLVTGLRLNELLRLRWGDVDEVRHRLAIRDSKTGPFTRIIGPELAGWFGSWRPVNAKGSVFDIADLRSAFVQAERHGGKRISAHDLRRTYLTFGERAGVPMTALKRLANHSTKGDVTSGYVHVNEADLQRWASIIEAAILCAARATSNVVLLRA